MDVPEGVVPNPTTVQVTSTAAAGVCYSLDGVTVPTCAADGGSCLSSSGTSYFSGAGPTALSPDITADTTVMVQGCHNVASNVDTHSLVTTFAYTTAGAWPTCDASSVALPLCL